MSSLPDSREIMMLAGIKAEIYPLRLKRPF